MTGDVRNAAVRLLARREHSARELGRKLRERGFARDAVEEVIEGLVGERLVDDRRFAEAMTASRAGRGQGPVRIRAVLQEHGLDEGLVQQALDESDTDWPALAAAVRKKRFGRLPADYRERARQARFLQYRGFTADQIQHALREDGLEQWDDAGPDDGTE